MSILKKLLGMSTDEPVAKKTKASAKTKEKATAKGKGSAASSKPATAAPAKRRPKAKKEKVEERELTPLEREKEEANKNKEPWVKVLDFQIDLDNVSDGSFTLDWNDYFVAKLVRAGYTGTDAEMVDQWFSQICRNILMENYEQEMADPAKRNSSKH